MQLHRYVRSIHNKNHIEVKKKYQQKNGKGEGKGGEEKQEGTLQWH